jgi:hypothetical protein
MLPRNSNAASSSVDAKTKIARQKEERPLSPAVTHEPEILLRARAREIDPLDYWRLCDELSVVQAALLIIGKDPSQFQDDIEAQKVENRPMGYDAAKAALINAIHGKRLDAHFSHDWRSTTIMVEDLRTWLRSRGITTGFFFPLREDTPNYLSQIHDHYSPKLAAAIEAWKAVSADDQLRRGKSVKQALVVWLRQHANDFGLTKNLAQQAIERLDEIVTARTETNVPRVSIGDAAEQAVHQMSAVMARDGAIGGITTGLKTLDNRTDGLQTRNTGRVMCGS